MKMTSLSFLLGIMAAACQVEESQTLKGPPGQPNALAQFSAQFSGKVLIPDSAAPLCALKLNSFAGTTLQATLLRVSLPHDNRHPNLEYLQSHYLGCPEDIVPLGEISASDEFDCGDPAQTSYGESFNRTSAEGKATDDRNPLSPTSGRTSQVKLALVANTIDANTPDRPQNPLDVQIFCRSKRIPGLHLLKFVQNETLSGWLKEIGQFSYFDVTLAAIGAD